MDKRIGELPDGRAIGNDSLFAAEQQGRAVKITGKQLRDLVKDSTGGSAEGGGGTGSNQGVISFNGRTGTVKPQTGDYTAQQVGAVPETRTINGKSLANNVLLTAEDLNIKSDIPDGGTAGQVLAKRSDANQDAHWIDPPEGGGFVEMASSIPPGQRKENTLYGLITGSTPTPPAETTTLTWEESALPSSGFWYGVTYGNGKFVAVGTRQIACSADGVNWTKANSSFSEFWRAVTYGNGKFVVVGDHQIAYSGDGNNWETAEFSGIWRGVTYGNGKFVAVGNGVSAYSIDGISWTETTPPSSELFSGVTYGSGKFVAVGDNQTAYSTDGISWTAVNVDAGEWRSVAYGNGKFAAVCDGQFAYSADGVHWTAASIPAGSWYGITYGNGRFVTVDFQNSKSAYTTDGVNWTEAAMPSGAWVNVTYGNSKFVALDNYGSKAAYSVESVSTRTVTETGSGDKLEQFQNSAGEDIYPKTVLEGVFRQSDGKSLENVLTELEGVVGPAGPKGDKGEKGDTGPQGPKGDKGDTGATGATGPAGPAGPTGATGPQGPAGTSGSTGPQGPAGPGVPTGGTAGQVLTKNSGTNYDTKWTTPATGVTSFNGRTGAVSPASGDYTAAQVGAVPTSRTVNSKALSSNISLTAADVGALPTSGGTITGNLRLKGSGNYGNILNFGDGDYAHISEPTDDCLEIKAKTINFVTSSTPPIQLNGAGLIQYGTSDLTAGSSSLKTGCVYLVYE